MLVPFSAVPFVSTAGVEGNQQWLRVYHVMTTFSVSSSLIQQPCGIDAIFISILQRREPVLRVYRSCSRSHIWWCTCFFLPPRGVRGCTRHRSISLGQWVAGRRRSRHSTEDSKYLTDTPNAAKSSMLNAPVFQRWARWLQTEALEKPGRRRQGWVWSQRMRGFS